MAGGGQTGGKSVRVGRWAKFLITSSGKETCNFKLRTGPQLFSQDSFRVWLGTYSASQREWPGCLKRVGSASVERGGWQVMAILLILIIPHFSRVPQEHLSHSTYLCRLSCGGTRLLSWNIKPVMDPATYRSPKAFPPMQRITKEFLVPIFLARGPAWWLRTCFQSQVRVCRVTSWTPSSLPADWITGPSSICSPICGAGMLPLGLREMLKLSGISAA